MWPDRGHPHSFPYRTDRSAMTTVLMLQTYRQSNQGEKGVLLANVHPEIWILGKKFWKEKVFFPQCTKSPNDCISGLFQTIYCLPYKPLRLLCKHDNYYISVITEHQTFILWEAELFPLTCSFNRRELLSKQWDNQKRLCVSADQSQPEVWKYCPCV